MVLPALTDFGIFAHGLDQVTLASIRWNTTRLDITREEIVAGQLVYFSEHGI